MPSALIALLSVVLTVANAGVTPLGSNASQTSATRKLQGDDFFPEDLEPVCDIAERVAEDVVKFVGEFAEQHDTMVEHLELFHDGLEIVTEAAEIAEYPVPILKAFHIASGWALSFLHMATPEKMVPIYPLGDSQCDQCSCSKERMAHSFELASLGNSELFYFNRVDVDISTQAVPVLQYCGPLPGGEWFETKYVADNIDESPLEQMCSTQLSENNLNLCLGSGNIIMNYVDIASRGHANAMSILDGLRDQGVTDSTPKYDSYDDDDALLQLLEGPFFWRFGQPRLASFLAYAQLIAGCYDRKPKGTDWGAENGAIGWSSLDDAKTSLENLVQAVRIDLDDLHEGLKEAAVRAALRLYKKKYIEVKQTTVCKTKKKKNPKVYVEFRDVNPDLGRRYTGIDLSQESTDYTGIPYSDARSCFSSTDRCNERAKDQPFYTSWEDDNREWHGSDWNVFAVGCYAAQKDGKSGDNAVYLPSQDLLDHWQPQHSIISEKASIARLDNHRNYTGNAGIGYGVDYYLDRFIRPLFETKYDSFFLKIRATLDKVETNAIQPMQQVLDDNREAYIKYLLSHSGSGLRVKNKDQELLSSTRLSNAATDDLVRRLSGSRRLAPDTKLHSDTFV